MTPESTLMTVMARSRFGCLLWIEFLLRYSEESFEYLGLGPYNSTTVDMTIAGGFSSPESQPQSCGTQVVPTTVSMLRGWIHR